MLRLINRSVGDEEFTNNFRTDTARKEMQVSTVLITSYWVLLFWRLFLWVEKSRRCMGRIYRYILNCRFCNDIHNRKCFRWHFNGLCGRTKKFHSTQAFLKSVGRHQLSNWKKSLVWIKGEFIVVFTQFHAWVLNTTEQCCLSSTLKLPSDLQKKLKKSL